ncbi:MAG: RapZ C-terminal domain-containing protein [Bacteroidota bacterium]
MSSATLTIYITSFSFKKGYPVNFTEHGGGHVFDCRAIPNPGVLDEYKQLTGRDVEVGEYIEKQPDSHEFILHTHAIVKQSIVRYQERGFTHLMVSFGCTGGQHRSVYFADQLAAYCKSQFKVNVVVHHREQGVDYKL